MTFLSEFSYPDVSQRRIVLLNSIISFIVLFYIYINAVIFLNYYYVYLPVLQIVFICAITGVFIGNLASKLIFFKTAKHRLIYIIADIIFIILCSSYLYFKLFIPENYYRLIYFFFKSPYYLITFLFLVSFFAGFKINYFLKISCGDFIDSKRAVSPFLLFMLIGSAAGIALSVIFYYFANLHFYAGLLVLSIIPTIFMIKLSYSPAPIFAQEINKTSGESKKTEKMYSRDDLFFIYLNFTYILIYFFLGFTSIVKFYGGFLHVKILFIFISLLSLSAGFLLSKIFKQVFWYIYAEMLYPVFFILTLLALFYYKDEVNLFHAMYIFIPVTVILGFSLFQTINHILLNKNHKERYNVINFSIFILPAPILISLNFIDFTYFWYFALLYTTAVMNIFIPVVYLLQSKIKEYKKILFFIFTLIFIPLLILMHLYFNIPMSKDLYIKYSSGFNNLSYINYNSQQIDNEATVQISGLKSFHANDPIIRNMKRSIVPVFLYTPDNNWNEVLIIDGNYKFFRNPILTLPKGINCLDYLPSRITDYKSLPVSGNQNFILEKSDISLFLDRNKSPYKIIIDIPNLFDHAINPFRFSKEYYDLINDHLSKDGIFVKIISENNRRDFILSDLYSIKSSFNNTIVYYFPGFLVLMSSNNANAFNLSIDNFNIIKQYFNSHTELKNLFYNEFHLLSHVLFLKIDDLISYKKEEKINPFYFFNKDKDFRLNESTISDFLENNNSFTELIDKVKFSYLYYEIRNQVAVSKYYLTEIKRSEIYEMNEDYENESALLVNLRRQAEYIPDLRKYLTDILTYKENYYYNTALRFEKDKRWEEARKLYKSIIIINNNNFEANYHLGILSIILQNLDESFNYLQNAMKLRKDHPKVFYQMGVLLFSSGRPKDALVYFEKAMELKEKTSSLLYYLGLSHEELGNLLLASGYFDQAFTLDPNDKNISSSIERIKEKIKTKSNGNTKDEQDSNIEGEQGEEVPLEVTEDARKVRLEQDKLESSVPQSLRKTDQNHNTNSGLRTEKTSLQTGGAPINEKTELNKPASKER